MAKKLLALDTLRAAARAVVAAYRDKTATRKERAAALDHLEMVIDRKQGRPGLSPETVDQIINRRTEGASMPVISRELGVSVSVVAKILKGGGRECG